MLPALALPLALLLAWAVGRAPAVAALQPESGTLVRSLQFSARVASRSSVEVGATLTGRVAEVLVREGAQVGAGAALLRLEDAEARAALAQAQALVAQARAAQAGAVGARLRAADAQLAQARAQQLAALAEQRRSAELVARGFLSPSRGDEAGRALAVAEAQLDAARAQHTALGANGSERAQADAQVAAAQAALTLAQERLAQTVIRAPAAARVLQRSVEPGQVVQPGRALLWLALDGPLELVAQVDERFLAELAVGQPARVQADAFPAQPFDARLQRISPHVDAQRGAIDLHFSLATVPPFLREDMTLALAVVTARREHARLLPLATLRGGGGGGGGSDGEVWVVADGRIESRKLRLGLRSAAQVEVLAGVADDDWVVLGKAPPPGSRARVVAADAAALRAGGSGGSDGGIGGAGDGAALSEAVGR